MSSSARLDNQAKWKERYLKTKLSDKMRRVSEYAEGTALGKVKMCQWVAGPGGIGKTHLYERAFRRHDRELVRLGSATMLGCLEALSCAAETKKVLLFEDPSRKLLSDENFWLILMAAADGRPYTHKTLNDSVTYQLKGCLWVIHSNYTMESLVAKVNAALIQPFESRIIHPEIEADNNDLLALTCYLAIVEDMLRLQAGANLACANAALEYYEEHWHVLKDVSPRVLVRIATLIKQAPTLWKDIMTDSLKKIGSKLRYTGDIPQIVV